VFSSKRRVYIIIDSCKQTAKKQQPGGDTCKMYLVDPLDGGTESKQTPEMFNIAVSVNK